MALALSLTINAQLVINQSVSLSVDSHIVDNSSTQYVQPYQGNCNIISGNITINGDLNLNGNVLYLKQNTSLTVSGNINGSGEIRLCNNGNNLSSVSVCSSGNIQNNPNLNGITCSSLSSIKFTLSRDLGYNYIIYNLAGQKIKEGITATDMYYDIPKNTFLIVKVEGFREEKIMIR